MQNKNLVIIGALVVLAVISGALIYIIKADKLADFWSEVMTTQIEETDKEIIEEKEETVLEESKEESIYQETLLTKDDFLITLPAGWQEISDFLGTLLMAVDATKEITDEKAIEADFMTNLSIKSDDFKKYNKDYILEEYVNTVKIDLTQNILGIEFTYENIDIINGNKTIFVEVESTQDEVNFKTLLVFIEGKDDVVWAISFNTLKTSWLTYKNSFYQIVESFELR